MLTQVASSFLIICHNVLEYIEFKEQVLYNFKRLLKKDGVISIVKHNHTGRIMSKVIFENKIDEAIDLLDGAELQVKNFGKVWSDKMLQVEMKVSEINEFKNIAFFHHVILGTE